MNERSPLSLALRAKTDRDHQRFVVSMQALMAEDPTVRLTAGREAGWMIVHGMGELHLKVIVDRLRRDFAVEAFVGTPQVAYKETLTRSADGEMKYARRTGDRSHYGHREDSRVSRTTG